MRPHASQRSDSPIARGVGVVTKCMCARPTRTGARARMRVQLAGGGGPLAGGTAAGGCGAWAETPEEMRRRGAPV